MFGDDLTIRTAVARDEEDTTSMGLTKVIKGDLEIRTQTNGLLKTIMVFAVVLDFCISRFIRSVPSHFFEHLHLACFGVYLIIKTFCFLGEISINP